MHSLKGINQNKGYLVQSSGAGYSLPVVAYLLGVLPKDLCMVFSQVAPSLVRLPPQPPC